MLLGRKLFFLFSFFRKHILKVSIFWIYTSRSSNLLFFVGTFTDPVFDEPLPATFVGHALTSTGTLYSLYWSCPGTVEAQIFERSFPYDMSKELELPLFDYMKKFPLHPNTSQYLFIIDPVHVRVNQTKVMIRFINCYIFYRKGDLVR